MNFKNRASWMLFEAPKDGGAPSGETQAPPTEPSTPAPQQSNEKMLPQSEVNRIVQERLREKEERDKKNKQKEEGQYQALSETQAKELEEKTGKLTEYEGTVKTLTTELGDYKKLVQAMIKDQRKLIPAHFLTIFDELSELRQAQWLADNADKLVTEGTQAPKQVPGVPPSPKPQGQQGGMSIVDQYIANRNKKPEGQV
jgi:hypothetical protein